LVPQTLVGKGGKFLKGPKWVILKEGGKPQGFKPSPEKEPNP